MRSWHDAKIKWELPLGPELEFPKGVRENQLALTEEVGRGAQGAGHESVQRGSALTTGEICKDGTLWLSVRPDCGEETDGNYN